ncbi:hypothetical protein [Longimicrobium terrae]|uniref:SMI1/KNR4 family protein n=1 Tax=Longimicrobium terrae TaxID=1639882 RepID=A0A841H2F4_9BACT|nr:hypothetical protein [Longimicrobium terrae]MBB4637810.1 hypothetical protein [Longimicrobium terrae]MBB6072335.1 hypothetical protein [Longimicrobium terrae]NNC31254.1 hypothetical protein [Longimicrobium terrae]
MVRVDDGIDAFARGVRDHGLGSFRAAAPDEVAEVESALVPFTDALRQWHLRASPVDVWLPWVAEDMAFFSLDSLHGAQAGYRWHGYDEGQALLDGWNPAWLVIAEFSGDPVIASLDSIETPVSFARHGAGSWSPREVAPGLPSFLSAMAVWMDVCLGEYGGEIMDDDFELKADFKERLDGALAGVLGAEHRAAFLSFLE